MEVPSWGSCGSMGCLEGSSVWELLWGWTRSGPSLSSPCSLPLTFLGGDGWPESSSWHPEFRNLRHVVLGPDGGGCPPSQDQGVRCYHKLDISFRVEVAGGHVQTGPKRLLPLRSVVELSRPPLPHSWKGAHLAPPCDGLTCWEGAGVNSYFQVFPALLAAQVTSNCRPEVLEAGCGETSPRAWSAPLRQSWRSAGGSLTPGLCSS